MVIPKVVYECIFRRSLHTWKLVTMFRYYRVQRKLQLFATHPLDGDGDQTGNYWKYIVKIHSKTGKDLGYAQRNTSWSLASGGSP
jgi:hypothetical protein